MSLAKFSPSLNDNRELRLRGLVGSAACGAVQTAWSASLISVELLPVGGGDRGHGCAVGVVCGYVNSTRPARPLHQERHGLQG